MTFLWWLGWLIAVAANAFIVFLFVIFGLAAGAGADTTTFKMFTATCVSGTLLLSLLLMFKARYLPGILVTVLWFPIMAIVGPTLGHLFKS